MKQPHTITPIQDLEGLNTITQIQDLEGLDTQDLIQDLEGLDTMASDQGWTGEVCLSKA